MDEAKQFLSTLLATGPIDSEDALAMAIKSGFSEATIKRAKKALGIRSDRNGFGAGSTWLWFLPQSSKKSNECEEDHTNHVNPFVTNDPVRARLFNKYTEKINGYALSDILSHLSEEDDFEDLFEPGVMNAVIDALVKTGKLAKRDNGKI